MCGIAGFRLHDPAWLDEHGCARALEGMSAALHHRGPDDDGQLYRDGVGLAFARLSIIDLEGGHQPMLSPDGRYAMVFNGEIYNFRELREELRACGREFVTSSDSEVLLAMYEVHGPAMLPRLNGMFGLAVHDRRSGELFLARDRLGIKPLFWRQHERAFAFGSELKALVPLGLPAPGIDPVGFAQYLGYGFCNPPRTIYEGVQELPPGHSLRLVDGEPKVERWWRVERDDQVPTDMPAAVEQLELLLADSVRMRMVADVPLGAMLSGGIDSGLIVALMARQSDRPVKTFSVGFREERYNEMPWARRVAEMYGTDHTEITCEAAVHELVPRLATAFDQPFGDSSAVPTFMVCEEARKHVTVALSGDGGDEVFAGYGRHTVLQGRRLPPPPLKSLAGLVASVLPATAVGRQRLRRSSLDLMGHQADSLVIVDDVLRGRLAGPAMARTVRGYRVAAEALGAGGVFGDEGGLQRFQHQDLQLYLPADILAKVDRTSMLNSLELRVPLLDHRVVRFGLNLPPQLKNDGQHGKLILRELARRLLPEGHLEKPKTGFAIPAGQWLRAELRELLEDHLLDSQLARAGWLDQGALRWMVGQHHAGRPWASALWLLLVAELWYRDARRRGSVR